ncbi:hypothetical protein ABZ897_32945 [Nonomuraea sp. NPDC046802]|uniref:hypothetical protein n=1 Tax=Nonomuraea sp. NPDC046802 TaxID=3154919 RepID=UPI0033F6A8B7
MNPIETLVRNFQDLVAQVPEIVQPLIVMLAGAIPFIEGEGASPIGVLGRIHPIVAGIAAASGNFLCVVAVVLFSSRVRTTAVARRARRAETPAEPKPESKGRQRFRRYLVRFGVPGASLLGPLAIPTQFTSAMLVASGTPRGWVLLWQAVGIVVWTTVTTTLSWGMLTALLA